MEPTNSDPSYRSTALAFIGVRTTTVSAAAPRCSSPRRR
jgi:hypothetical protein